VDWDSLADDAQGLNFIDNVSCHRLNMALRSICLDDMGKAAVRDGLKLVRLKNVKDKTDMKIVFDAGVLEMHCAYGLGAEGLFSDNVIREVLEKNL
jgi:methyl coenzyme M reductase beta subunit